MEPPKRKHILVVDDDRLLAKLICHVLEGHGFRVSTATDGHQALLQLALDPIDIVVTDMQMPNCNGVELIAAMHQLDRKVPVLLMTSDYEAARSLTECEAVQVLRKPVDFCKALEIIHDMLYL